MRAANLFVHNMSSFRGYRKFILGVIRKWSSEAALNFEFIWVIDIPGLLCSLQFLSVILPVMEIKPHLFYQVVKNLGQPRPLITCGIPYKTVNSDDTWHSHLLRSL